MEAVKENTVKCTGLQYIDLKEGWKLALTWVDSDDNEVEDVITKEELDLILKEIKGLIMIWGIPRVGDNLMFADEQAEIMGVWIDCVEKEKVITLLLH